MIQPRTAAWIKEEAARLERAMIIELAERWPKHCRYTHDCLIQDVVDKHLNLLWSCEVIRSNQIDPSLPFAIRITRYNGPVDETGDTE